MSNQAFRLKQTPHQLNYVLIVFTGFLVALTFYGILHRELFEAYYWSTFFAFLGIASSLGLYHHYLLKNSNIKTFALLLILFVIIFSYVFFYKNNVSSYLISMLIFWSLGGLHFIQKIVTAPPNRAYFINALCLYLAFPLAIVLSQYLLVSNTLKGPLVQDELLLAIDGTLGFYPSLVLSQFIETLPLGIVSVIDLVYLTLPVTALFIYIKLENSKNKIPFSYIMELCLIGIIGYALYHIVPACGTHYAFNQTWPFSLPATFSQKTPQPISCPLNYPRNCVPSLHTAWTITLLRYSWLLDPFTKIFIAVLAFITLFAVFGIGAHYLVDIVVGLAFANCIGGITSTQLSFKNPARLYSIIGGALLCAIWYVLILNGIKLMQSSKIVAWFFFSVSIGISFKLELLLYRTLSQR